MRGESLRLNGGGGDDDLQVRPARQELVQIAQQEVDVEAAFVGLVDDECVVAQQPAVALNLGEQDAVGHQFHQGAVADLVGESDAVADSLPELAAEFSGDALGDGARGQPPGLGVADGAAHPAAHLQADLRQLGGLARAGLPGHDDDLMGGDRVGQFTAQRADRKVGVADRRHGRLAGGHHGLCDVDLAVQRRHLLGVDRAVQRLQLAAQPGGVAQGQSVQPCTHRAHVITGGLGHWTEDSCDPNAGSCGRWGHVDCFNHRRDGAGRHGAGRQSVGPA